MGRRGRKGKKRDSGIIYYSFAIRCIINIYERSRLVHQNILLHRHSITSTNLLLRSNKRRRKLLLKKYKSQKHKMTKEK